MYHQGSRDNGIDAYEAPAVTMFTSLLDDLAFGSEPEAYERSKSHQDGEASPSQHMSFQQPRSNPLPPIRRTSDQSISQNPSAEGSSKGQLPAKGGKKRGKYVSSAW